MFGKFWGNHMNGKLVEIMNHINEDNPDCMIKILPLNEKGAYGSPQLMLSEKPSDKCIERIREEYKVTFFKNDDCSDEYKFLMIIETLRYNYEEGWHWNDKLGKDLPKSVTGNKWDFDGYFFVTDAYNSYSRIAIFPFKQNTDIDSGHNLHKHEAFALVKWFVKQLNEGIDLE